MYAAEPRRFGLADRAEACGGWASSPRSTGSRWTRRRGSATCRSGSGSAWRSSSCCYRGARTLILDEPTAVLTPAEADGLFAVLRSLADDGRTVLLVTHKLREVMEGSDR